MKRQTVAEWLTKHVERAGGGECWPAHGGGYNQRGWHVTFKAEGKRHLAHRAAWEQVNGPIPAGMCILHKCDNPKCCNPEHLTLGTQSDNAKDMWRKKRGRVTGDSRRGVKLGPSPYRRLTPEQVSAVFAKYAQGATQKSIAAELGVSDVTVSNILRGRMYPELADRAPEVKHLLGRGTKQRKPNADSSSRHRDLLVNRPQPDEDVADSLRDVAQDADHHRRAQVRGLAD